jgi:hypothetical protein
MAFTKGRILPFSRLTTIVSRPVHAQKKKKAHSLRRHYPAQVQRDFLSLLLSTTPASLGVETGQAPLVPLQLVNVYLTL